MPRVKVVINGTDKNPWAKYGLSCNPFPQIGEHESMGAEQILQKLDSEPINTVEQLKKILKECTPEFINLCCSQFKVGKRVKFEVSW